MHKRIRQQGLEIVPHIFVVTRLIPDSKGTSCNQRLEKINGTSNAQVLRVPFRQENGEILQQWVSRCVFPTNTLPPRPLFFLPPPAVPSPPPPKKKGRVTLSGVLGCLPSCPPAGTFHARVGSVSCLLFLLTCCSSSPFSLDSIVQDATISLSTCIVVTLHQLRHSRVSLSN